MRVQFRLLVVTATIPVVVMGFPASAIAYEGTPQGPAAARQQPPPDDGGDDTVVVGEVGEGAVPPQAPDAPEEQDDPGDDQRESGADDPAGSGFVDEPAAAPAPAGGTSSGVTATPPASGSAASAPLPRGIPRGGLRTGGGSTATDVAGDTPPAALAVGAGLLVACAAAFGRRRLTAKR